MFPDEGPPSRPIGPAWGLAIWKRDLHRLVSLDHPGDPGGDGVRALDVLASATAVPSLASRAARCHCRRLLLIHVPSEDLVIRRQAYYTVGQRSARADHQSIHTLLDADAQSRAGNGRMPPLPLASTIARRDREALGRPPAPQTFPGRHWRRVSRWPSGRRTEPGRSPHLNCPFSTARRASLRIGLEGWAWSSRRALAPARGARGFVTGLRGHGAVAEYAVAPRSRDAGRASQGRWHHRASSTIRRTRARAARCHRSHLPRAREPRSLRRRCALCPPARPRRRRDRGPARQVMERLAWCGGARLERLEAGAVSRPDANGGSGRRLGPRSCATASARPRWAPRRALDPLWESRARGDRRPDPRRFT